MDDDEANRDMLSRRLERLGYPCRWPRTGRPRSDRIAEQPFDLVLLDIVMPGARRLRGAAAPQADDALRHIPVIVLSASDELDSAVRCIELGAEDYLPKPIDAVLLRARIGACLEKKRLHDQEQRHLATIEAMAAELAEWNRTLEQRVAEQVAQLDRVGRLKRFLPASSPRRSSRPATSRCWRATAARSRSSSATCAASRPSPRRPSRRR